MLAYKEVATETLKHEKKLSILTTDGKIHIKIKCQKL